jgi:putative transferase (TIGR04331 family)
MFLATTATDKFWNKSDKILFLGEWCKLHSKREMWSNLEAETLEYPWEDREAMYHSYDYLKILYEDILIELSDYLNNVFNQNHNTKFWRIIIGPWLLHHIQIFYERYICIKKGLEAYPSITTVALSKDSFSLTYDFWDYFQRATNDDIFNLQMYTSILEEMSFDFVKVVSLNKTTNTHNRNRYSFNGLKEAIRKRILSLFDRLTSIIAMNSPVIMVDIYLPRVLIYKFMLYTNLKCSWYKPNTAETNINKHSYTQFKLNNERIGLSTVKLIDMDEFQAILVKTLPYFFPKIYLENFDFTFSSIRSIWNNKSPKVLITANAFLGNEHFKILAAFLNQEKGTKLVGAQHGGNYGSARLNTNEVIEESASDTFWTWGWNNATVDSRQISNPKLSFLSKKAKSVNASDNKYILYVGNNIKRYFYRMWSCPISSQGLDYINQKLRFLEKVSPETLALLIYRPFQIDTKWDIENRIREKFPKLRISNRQDYYKQLLNAYLVVCDMNQTTILESLVANIPTIAFWNPSHWEIRDMAQPFYDQLVNVGILFYTPEEAAIAVNQRNEDIQKWWKKSKTQKARCEFVNHFAKHSPNWEREWSDELSKY